MHILDKTFNTNENLNDIWLPDGFFQLNNIMIEHKYLREFRDTLKDLTKINICERSITFQFKKGYVIFNGGYIIYYDKSSEKVYSCIYIVENPILECNSTNKETLEKNYNQLENLFENYYYDYLQNVKIPSIESLTLSSSLDNYISFKNKILENEFDE